MCSFLICIRKIDAKYFLVINLLIKMQILVLLYVFSLKNLTGGKSVACFQNFVTYETQYLRRFIRDIKLDLQKLLNLHQ